MKKDYSEFLPLLLEFQRTEITEWAVYTRLARRTGGPNGEVLRRIGEDEKRHASIWERYTGKKIEPVLWKVWFFTLLAAVLGITFAIKLLEKGEEHAEKNYALVETAIPEAGRILREETEHEEELTSLIDEERLQYTSSMILGLNDALVELTGALAGFTLAFAQPRVVAMAGLITGVSASLSMAGSEYLGRKSEDDELSPARAATYTGLAYALTVMVLIAPYMVFSNLYLCLGVMLAATLLIIAFFNYYMAVARGQPFGARFLEMAGISLGIAALSFGIGALVRRCLPVEV